MSKSDTIWRRLGKRGWWLPVVTAVLGCFCAAVFNKWRPVYETTTAVQRDPYGDYIAITDDYLQSVLTAPIYDEVARQLELPGGSNELENAVQVQLPGYNPEMVVWVEGWRWQLPGIIAKWVPRPPPPPRHFEIRVRHTDPVIASQIGSTFVDAYNEHSRSIREAFIVMQLGELANKIHTTMTELALAMENPNSEVEQATLRNKLNVLLANHAALVKVLFSEAPVSPLAVVEPPVVPLAPIHTKQNHLVGTSAGAFVGFILYAARGKQNE
jgi:hypothetical protein